MKLLVLHFKRSLVYEIKKRNFNDMYSKTYILFQNQNNKLKRTHTNFIELGTINERDAFPAELVVFKTPDVKILYKMESPPINLFAD